MLEKHSGLNSESLVSATGDDDLVDPLGEGFAKAFPHLAPAVLRRQLSSEELRERAMSEAWNLARSVLGGMSWSKSDRCLIEEMVSIFLMRLFACGVISKFDPTVGTLDSFLYGVMRLVALECLRERSRRRREGPLDDFDVRSGQPGPRLIAEGNELTERFRDWARALPPAQRMAVARRFDVLADLDTGGFIPNEGVVRHRGMARIREMAREYIRKNGDK